MIAVLSNTTTSVATSPLPLIATLAIAAAVLIVIGVALRRLRVHGRLTFADATTGAATASFVLAVALLASASLGTPASAANVQSETDTPARTLVVSPVATLSTDSTIPIESTGSDEFQPIPLDGIEGFQLPTE